MPKDYLVYNVANMDVERLLRTALAREDVQRFLSRRRGICFCGQPVPLEDDGETLHTLSWAVFPRGRQPSLDIFSARSHHIAERRGAKGKVVCQGHVPLRDGWINPHSNQYDADFAEYVRLVQAVGIVNQDGRWILGELPKDSQQ